MVSSSTRLNLKNKLRKCERLFGGWISFYHPSIVETFINADFDFIAIDMEHSSINVEQAQRIIAASQSGNIPCFPRPVSHSNDWIKPLLESGADGIIIQMVNNSKDVENLINDIKYPPIGKRSYGVNRAQNYGFDFEKYVDSWNKESIFIIQIESREGVENINSLLSFDEIDGVMIGPLDISGSYGQPGKLTHPDVVKAINVVIDSCKKYNKSCGTQIADPNIKNVSQLFNDDYNFAILGSDLFALYNWTNNMNTIIKKFK